MAEEQETDYEKYRGKCKEFCEAELKKDPTLKMVRGWYDCIFDGKQCHWWLVRKDGSIFDPKVKQFKSNIGEYIEYEGILECAECGKEVKEKEADIEGNYSFCSYGCHSRFVGIFV